MKELKTVTKINEISITKEGVDIFTGERMRNSWLYLKFFKSQAGIGTSLLKAKIHNIVMTYFD